MARKSFHGKGGGKSFFTEATDLNILPEVLDLEEFSEAFHAVIQDPRKFAEILLNQSTLSKPGTAVSDTEAGVPAMGIDRLQEPLCFPVRPVAQLSPQLAFVRTFIVVSFDLTRQRARFVVW